MENREFSQALADLPLGQLFYYKQISSTNDIALNLAAQGAPDMSLVYAEEQLSGRGRSRRRWLTPQASSLAFSLIIRPLEIEKVSIPLFTGLGAVAVCQVINQMNLASVIKWPNDLLLGGKKFCGILAESIWIGDQLNHVVLGIGLNVTRDSIPATGDLEYPATCLEVEMGECMDRLGLLRKLIFGIIAWRKLINDGKLIQYWEDNLAYRGEAVDVSVDSHKILTGKIDGLERDGSLRIILPNDQLTKVIFGEVHLRAVV